MDKYCFKCGDKNPYYKVDGYDRSCLSCGGDSCVLSINEMVDLINDLHLKGQVGDTLEYIVEEDYNKLELDFDNASMTKDERTAFDDFIRDYEED